MHAIDKTCQIQENSWMQSDKLKDENNQKKMQGIFIYLN